MKYTYFEERASVDIRSRRRRGVELKSTLSQMELTNCDPGPSVEYIADRAKPFDTPEDVEALGGANWQLNAMRVVRGQGAPSITNCPLGTAPNDWPEDIDEIARRQTIHHYFRAWDSDECIRLPHHGNQVELSIEITKDWFDPPNGIIDHPGQWAEIRGSHSVLVVGFDSRTGLFSFHNWWGDEWGDRGTGYINQEILDDFLVEAWVTEGLGVVPRLRQNCGCSYLLWGVPIRPGVTLHGREIVDAATGDRIAWAFVMRRESHWEIQELFVRPEHRGCG
jgi:hypothetical protein